MSKEQVRKFFEKVEVDEVLQQKLEVLEKETSDEKMRKASIEKIVDIAETVGFIFTKQDFIDAITETPIEGKQESAETLSHKSCIAAYSWDNCVLAYGSPPVKPCEQGSQSYVIPGYQPGDEDKV